MREGDTEAMTQRRCNPDWSAKERLLFYTDLPKDWTKCWEWNGSKRAGYGWLKIRDRRMAASRWMLEVKLGRKIREGKFSCHHCDNRGCVNPAHLYEGTALQNRADMDARNKTFKQARGERINTAKLTAKQVRAIRATSGTQNEIADRYGVHRSLIGYIKRRQVWAHV
jgi:hypothetical protein